MAMYLNQNNSKFQKYLKNKIFVDKSLLIKETNENLNKESRKFVCLTHPRRFGKSLALSMLNAYYSKGCDSRELFKDLAISKDPSFEEHLNKHNVFCIDMNSLYSNLGDHNNLVPTLKRRILTDLGEAYSISFPPDCPLNVAFAKIRSICDDRFIFLIDEWDVVYRKAGSNVRLCDAYAEFLEGLFKSGDVSSMIDLVYMTGILPIRKGVDQSGLNVFKEYTMFSSWRLAPFIGFTEDEVKGLCEKRGADFAKIKSWYDGYPLGGMAIYNPVSVVKAIERGRCDGYWTSTSAIEAVTNYMNYDRGALKGEIIRMLAGERVMVSPRRFDNDLTKVDSKDAALSVLVHFGYLAYTRDPDGHGGACRIPNKEIRMEFKRAIEMLGWK